MVHDVERQSKSDETTSDSHDTGDASVEIFESARPRLLGIAYRILGSHAEAQDAVQDIALRWHEADVATIASPGAWLTAACTRRSIDMLRAAYRSRVTYVGTWLPEPVATPQVAESDTQMELSSSLTTAFLLMLERLTPKERAAYLLYEIFDMPYVDVSASLDMKEATCRKLVSRAKARIGNTETRYRPTRARQEELITAFLDAVRTGQPGGLATMLASDVRLTADGGGKVPSLTEVLRGQSVIAFLTERLSERWQAFEWTRAELNGGRGLVLREEGEIVATVSFGFDRLDRVVDIFVTRDPDKLAIFGQASIR